MRLADRYIYGPLNDGFIGCVEPRCRRAAVATGCPAANCDVARAACGATASRVGARASVFHIQEHVGAALQLRGGRLAGRARNTNRAQLISCRGARAAQSIADGEVRLGETSACLAPARSGGTSRRRAASIGIDRGALLRHERWKRRQGEAARPARRWKRGRGGGTDRAPLNSKHTGGGVAVLVAKPACLRVGSRSSAARLRRLSRNRWKYGHAPAAAPRCASKPSAASQACCVAISSVHGRISAAARASRA